VEGLLFRGHPEVVDADRADYFGSIPHADLLQSVARRIVDRRVLHLIKMWLETTKILKNDHAPRRHGVTRRRNGTDIGVWRLVRSEWSLCLWRIGDLLWCIPSCFQ
jgi:retron-type reverse transcriptase